MKFHRFRWSIVTLSALNWIQQKTHPKTFLTGVGEISVRLSSGLNINSTSSPGKTATASLTLLHGCFPTAAPRWEIWILLCGSDENRPNRSTQSLLYITVFSEKKTERMLHWLNTDWYVTIDHTTDRLCIDWSICRSIYLSIYPFIYLKTFPANPTLKSTSLKQNLSHIRKFYLSFFCGVCHSLFPPHPPKFIPPKGIFLLMAEKTEENSPTPKCSEKNKSPNLGIGSVFLGGDWIRPNPWSFFWNYFCAGPKDMFFW